jgi:hypothetical protein
MWRLESLRARRIALSTCGWRPARATVLPSVGSSPSLSARVDRQRACDDRRALRQSSATVGNSVRQISLDERGIRVREHTSEPSAPNCVAALPIQACR